MNEKSCTAPVSVHCTEIFIVALASNPTTGYDWYLDKLDKKSFAIIEEKYLAPKTNLIGAGGTKMFRLKALKTGKKAVKLAYYRVWEGRKSAIKEIKFDLRVK